MYFTLSVHILQPAEVCFAFLRDKNTFPQNADSPVLKLEKTTPGPVGVGTRYFEVVRMLPFIEGEIHSVVTLFEPPVWLAEDFEGAGMVGDLSYQFIPQNGGTILIQREQLHLVGWLRVFEPLIHTLLKPRLHQRLEAIKVVIEKKGAEKI